MAGDVTGENPRLSEVYERRLEQIADSGGPLGIWFRQTREDMSVLGDLETRGRYAFLFAGFRAYLEASDDPVAMQGLDAVLQDRPKASRLLGDIVSPPAFAALAAFYDQNFGDHTEYPEAYLNFHGVEIDTMKLKPVLSLVCFDQRVFDKHQQG